MTEKERKDRIAQLRRDLSDMDARRDAIRREIMFLLTPDEAMADYAVLLKSAPQ